jgi:predicted enzyme related to lactoylglutathione lyase
MRERAAPAKERANPFKRLAYVYAGTSDFDGDLAFYKDVLGARLLWNVKDFGARVAAFDLCGEPYLLIADHVNAPSKRLIYEVDDLDETIKDLTARGWKPDGGRFEIPDGPCVNFSDASGNEYAILQMSRPHILEERRAAGARKSPPP